MKQEKIERLPAPICTIWQAFQQWWDDLVKQALINLIWSLSWLTIILGPPVTFGVYYVESEYVRGSNPGLPGLLEGSRKYFFKSWVWMLVNLLVGILIYASANAYLQIGGFWATAARDVTILLGSAWFIIQFYALPILMVQERKSLLEAWRNSLFMSFASPLYLLVLLLFLIFAGAFSLLLIFPIILGYFTLVSILANQAVKDRLEAFQEISRKSQSNEEEREEAENNQQD
jgi:uncharacterized membrane protein YesL